MSTAAANTSANSAALSAGGLKRKHRLVVLLAPPLVLVAVLTVLWFTGILPNLLGLKHDPQAAGAERVAPPVFVDLPEMIANLNPGASHRQSYVKLLARIEVATQEDADRVRQTIPRLQDLFQSYLREIRPEELRGSGGTYRLREELIARANVAAAPAHVRDVLFIQMLVQ